MGWELYDKAKHGAKSSSHVYGIAGWKRCCKLAGRDIDASQVSIDNNRVNFSAIGKLHRNKELPISRTRLYPDKIVIRDFDGWGEFTIPNCILEIFVKDKGEYGEHGKWSRVTTDTLLVAFDQVRVRTMTEMTEQYTCSMGYETLYINRLKRPIKHVTRQIDSVDSSSWKKMRKGQHLTTGMIDQKAKTVTLDGTYGDQFVIPFEYLEFDPSPRTSTAKRKEQYGYVKQLSGAMAALKDTKTKLEKQTKTDKKDTTMELGALNFNAKEIIDGNKDALLTVAKLEVGEAAVAQLTKIIRKRLPMMLRGYAGEPWFDVVVANMVVMALKQFAPENKKAQIVADAMLVVAYKKQVEAFDIQGMINEFVDSVDVSGITKLDKTED